MQYAFFGTAKSESLDRFARLIGDALEGVGFTSSNGDAQDATLVISLLDLDDPKPFRRRGKGTYVVGVFERAAHPEPIEESLKADYPQLLRGLANLVLDYVPGQGAWFTTMERGHYGITADDEQQLAQKVVERLLPLASSRLVIDNEFRTDLEEELWDGDEITISIRKAGVRLQELDLLPSPFPIEDLLSERELRHVKRLYGIGGLSYGNLSARKDERRFWMSASGVDKSRLEVPGRDILLVSDYDSEHGRMVLSVPPDVEPRRVSVDAIEHWMIYQAAPRHRRDRPRPRVDGGHRRHRRELPVRHGGAGAGGRPARRRAPDPDHAVVGLRNHGITVTGPSLRRSSTASSL